MTANFLDLFSGIGGFALGAQMAGFHFQHHYFSEIDEFSHKIYAKNFPTANALGDVRTINAHELPHGNWILTGGFPCQPFSIAGKQRGTADDRYLWGEMFRLIEELRPRWVIAENVLGIVNLALDCVLSDLESADYAVEAAIIPACALNAPHKRERVWIIAHSDRERESSRALNGASSKISLANTDRTPTEHSVQAGRDFAPSSFGRTTEPALCGTNDGLPNRVDRIRALGNAVVPQIVAEIFRGIATVEASSAAE
jgi:DNA (cytosine-5)-methyltransferase 1